MEKMFTQDTSQRRFPCWIGGGCWSTAMSGEEGRKEDTGIMVDQARTNIIRLRYI